jgi:PAS domain S-box-containing protein
MSTPHADYILEHGGIAILTISKDGLIQSFNASAVNFYGIPAAKIIGQPLITLIPPDHHTTHERAIHLAGLQNSAVELETQHYHHDHLIDTRVIISAIHDEGALVGFSLFVIDITKQMRIQTALQHERNVLESILEATNDAIVMVDTNQHIQTINLRFETLFQLPRYQFILRPASDLIAAIDNTPHLPKAFANMFMSLATDIYENAGGELTLPGPTPIDLIWYSTPVYAHDGSIIGRLFVFRDVTQERQSDRMKTEFVALVSHELRTPLTPIQGFSEMLMDEEMGVLDPNLREIVTIIKANADRLAALITDILDLTKIDSGHIEIRPEIHDIRQIFNVVRTSMDGTLARKKQQLSITVPSNLFNIFVDADRLIQILTNLLENASKYSPEKQTVSLSVVMVEDSQDLPPNAPDNIRLPAFLFIVHDDGIGIPPEEQTHVFKRFFRSDQAMRQQIQGTGLGLTVVKSFVEMQGGHVWLHSMPGEGTTFYCTIPHIEGLA